MVQSLIERSLAAFKSRTSSPGSKAIIWPRCRGVRGFRLGLSFMTFATAVPVTILPLFVLSLLSIIMNSYSYITHLGASRKNFRGIVSACEGLRRSARRRENALGGPISNDPVTCWEGHLRPKASHPSKVWGRYGRHMYRTSPASGGCNFAAPVFNRQAKM